MKDVELYIQISNEILTINHGEYVIYGCTSPEALGAMIEAYAETIEHEGRAA